MDIKTVYAKLNEVFRDVFDDDSITVGPKTTAKSCSLKKKQAIMARSVTNTIRHRRERSSLRWSQKVTKGER